MFNLFKRKRNKKENEFTEIAQRNMDQLMRWQEEQTAAVAKATEGLDEYLDSVLSWLNEQKEEDVKVTGLYTEERLHAMEVEDYLMYF